MSAEPAGQIPAVAPSVEGSHRPAFQAVERLYVEHSASVREFLFRLCRNPHLADDLSSATFERALRHMLRRGGDDIENPGAWLKVVARNLLTDHYRTPSARREVVSDDVAEMLERVAASSSDATASEALEEIRELLASLTPNQRTAVVLQAVADLDTRQTAALMGRTPQAVRNLRHRATKRMVKARDSQDDSKGLRA